MPYLNNAYLEGVRPSPALVHYLQVLQQATGEMASINHLQENVVVAVLQLDGTRPARVIGGNSGYASPAHATAAGRVLHARLPPAERERLPGVAELP